MTKSQSTPLRQAVVLLSALSKPQRSAILERLDPAHAAKIAEQLGQPAAVDTAEFHCAVSQFIQVRRHASRRNPKPSPVTERATESLIPARDSGPSPSDPQPLPGAKTVAALIDDLPLDRCLDLLQGEDSSFLAAVLFLISTKRCAEIIEQMELRNRTRVLLDLASIAEIPAATVEHIRKTLQRKLEFGGSIHARPEGIHRIRQVLEHLDPSLQGTIADSLVTSDPKLAAELHRHVFRFNDLLRLTRADLKKLLPYVDPTLWAPALRHADERVRKHVFAAMTAAAGKLLQRELDVLGTLAIDQSTARQQQIVHVAQELFRSRVIARPPLSGSQTSAA